MIDSALKRQIKHTPTVMEPSVPVHTLVKTVDAEDITNEKSRTLALHEEFKNVTSKLESQNLSQFVIQILNFCLHKLLIRKRKVNFNLLNTVIPVVRPINLFQNVIGNNAKMSKESENLVFDRNHL